MPRRRNSSSRGGGDDCSSSACSPTSTQMTAVGPSPLTSLSQSLQHARKSADNLLATAQQNTALVSLRHQAEAKLKASLSKVDGRLEDLDILRRLAPAASTSSGASNTASHQRTLASPLRRSWSVNLVPPANRDCDGVVGSASDGDLSRLLRMSTAAVAEQVVVVVCAHVCVCVATVSTPPTPSTGGAACIAGCSTLNRRSGQDTPTGTQNSTVDSTGNHEQLSRQLANTWQFDYTQHHCNNKQLVATAWGGGRHAIGAAIAHVVVAIFRGHCRWNAWAISGV